MRALVVFSVSDDGERWAPKRHAVDNVFLYRFFINVFYVDYAKRIFTHL